MCVWVCEKIHTHTYVYVYTYIYIYIYMYVYAQVFNFIVDQTVKHDETCRFLIAIFPAMRNKCEHQPYQPKEHVGEDMSDRFQKKKRRHKYNLDTIPWMPCIMFSKEGICCSKKEVSISAQPHIAHPLAHKAAGQIGHLSMQVLQILRGPSAVTPPETKRPGWGARAFNSTLW